MDSLARTYSSSVDLPEEITSNCHKLCCRPLHVNLTMMDTSLMPLMLLLPFLVPLLLSILLMLFLSFLLPFLFFYVSIIRSSLRCTQVWRTLPRWWGRLSRQQSLWVKHFVQPKLLKQKLMPNQDYIIVKVNLFDGSGLQRTLVGSLPALHGQVSEALRGAGLCLRWLFLYRTSASKSPSAPTMDLGAQD